MVEASKSAGRLFLAVCMKWILDGRLGGELSKN
jgi:hypothetical protein